MWQLKSKKLYVSIFLILLIVCIQLVFVNSTTILSDGFLNDTDITSLGLNLTISFQSPLYTGVIINNDSIFFENLRSGGLINKSLSFNLTKGNATYNSSALPLITIYNTTFIKISYGINESINVTLTDISVSSCNVESVTIDNGTTLKTYSNPTCIESPLPFINLTDIPIQNGGINITYYIGSGGSSNVGGQGTVVNQTNISANETSLIETPLKEELSTLQIAGIVLIVIIIVGFLLNQFKR